MVESDKELRRIGDDDSYETILIGEQLFWVRRVEPGVIEKERLEELWQKLDQNNGALAGLTGRDLLPKEE